MRRMICAENRSGTFVPVELIRWARDGKVQVLRRRVVEGHGIFGVYFAVPVMQLDDEDGRQALARKLAELPR